MKTSFNSGKAGRNLSVLIFALLISFGLVAQTTITSTTTGGVWNAASTWVGGIVPGASNNVTISGPVGINGDFTCNSITISSSGSIRNQYAYSPTFTVNGKITNNGSVIKNPDGFSFYLKVLGDIENNGIWAPDQTSLSGNSDQNLKQAIGKSFQGYFLTNDDVGQIVLGSDVSFSGNRWDWSKSKLLTNGYKLTTVNCQLNNGIIVSDDNLILKNTGIATMTFNGNYKISGKVRIQGDNVFNGIATVMDTLSNDYAFSPTLTVNGKIINNGKIIKNPAGYSFYLSIFNNIENNGVWEPTQTTFSGKSDQNIKQTAGKSFQGYFLTADPLCQIVLGSDVTFDSNTWDWNKSKLLTNGFKLTTQNYQLNNGIISSNDNLILKKTGIANMTFNGNYKIGGKVGVQTNNVFNGTATIIDTLYNQYAFSPSLTVNGKIINNGVIFSNPGGYSFYLNILNDIENNGKWAPTQTTLSGITDQNIKQATGKSFQGYFLTADTLGQIVLGSDVTFDGNKWDFTKSKLRTNGFKLTTLKCQLNNGTIISNDIMNLRNTGIASMTFNGSYKLGGRVRVQGDNVFNGTVTVLDTLNNDYAFSPSLTVNAKIINNGTIISHPSGYSFYLNILNDVENNGKWAPSQTTFSRKADQRLKQSSGKSFQGYMLTTDSIGDIILDSNVLFDGNTWDMNNCQIQTNKFKLLTRNYLMSKGKILSNDTLVLRNSRISGMIFNGNYKIGGKVGIQEGNLFNGTITVLDTLYNQYAFSPTPTFSGDLINKGTISNHPSGYSLNMRIKGNLTNHRILK